MKGTIQKKKDSCSDFQGLLLVFECSVVTISSHLFKRRFTHYEDIPSLLRNFQYRELRIMPVQLLIYTRAFQPFQPTGRIRPARQYCATHEIIYILIFQMFSRAGPRGRGREWATLGVHPLSWLLSNNRLEEVCVTLTKGTFSSRLLLSNQDKGCTPSVAHFFLFLFLPIFA